MTENESNEIPEEIDFGNELDLHHFHPKDTKIVVEEFIRQAVAKRLEVIRIIHGRGRSVKKREIYKYLENHKNVMTFKDDGSNWGSTVIRLKF